MASLGILEQPFVAAEGFLDEFVPEFKASCSAKAKLFTLILLSASMYPHTSSDQAVNVAFDSFSLPGIGN